MLLLGEAGSGKSIGLQIKFMDAINAWKLGDPLPIYFNLANNIDLLQILDSINNELGTNITIDNIKNQHFFIDSFDEGLGILENRETLIKYYVSMLGSNTKILITCRTDYLISDNDYSWFYIDKK